MSRYPDSATQEYLGVPRTDSQNRQEIVEKKTVKYLEEIVISLTHFLQTDMQSTVDALVALVSGDVKTAIGENFELNLKNAPLSSEKVITRSEILDNQTLQPGQESGATSEIERAIIAQRENFYKIYVELSKVLLFISRKLNATFQGTAPVEQNGEQALNSIKAEFLHYTQSKAEYRELTTKLKEVIDSLLLSVLEIDHRMNNLGSQIAQKPDSTQKKPPAEQSQAALYSAKDFMRRMGLGERDKNPPTKYDPIALARILTQSFETIFHTDIPSANDISSAQELMLPFARKIVRSEVIQSDPEVAEAKKKDETYDKLIKFIYQQILDSFKSASGNNYIEVDLYYLSGEKLESIKNAILNALVGQNELYNSLSKLGIDESILRDVISNSTMQMDDKNNITSLKMSLPINANERNIIVVFRLVPGENNHWRPDLDFKAEDVATIYQVNQDQVLLNTRERLAKDIVKKYVR